MKQTHEEIEVKTEHSSHDFLGQSVFLGEKDFFFCVELALLGEGNAEGLASCISLHAVALGSSPMRRKHCPFPAIRTARELDC